MSTHRLVLVCVALVVSGCHAPQLQSIDQTVAEIAASPYDLAPTTAVPRPVQARPAEGEDRPAKEEARPAPAAPSAEAAPVRPARDNVIRTSYTPPTEDSTPGQVPTTLRKFDLKIPPVLPGAETPLVKLPSERRERDAAVTRLYPELPPTPDEPMPLPGPNGHPYTLTDFQQIAAANSPTLRQAASDVEAARGLWVQAGLYPNPTMGYETAPNANNTSSATQGAFIDQVVVTGGKIKLQAAAAQMNLKNAELALKRARFDLANTIRGDYYSLLVARETVRVNKGLVHLTDEIFRLQADLLAARLAASHEPAGLRSQAYVVRLAYSQAIAGYVAAWKQLVADMGVKQLPLSQVEGQVDQLIPYYDYDAVLSHVLHNHTDVLTARNTLQAAKYTLKLAQVVPVSPDVDVHIDLYKENNVYPWQHYHQLSLSVPVPLWNRNQGNIRTAAAALARAGEGPHQVEVNLTTGLAAAYGSYKSNLAAIEYYRRNILPDQVRYYRGIFERRRIDPGANFGDLVQAQQTLTTDVTAYLQVLGTLWTSVLNVTNYLQTSDLYQIGRPMELAPLPDFESLNSWPCPHPNVVCPPTVVQPGPGPGPVPNVETTTRAGTRPSSPTSEPMTSNPLAAANDRKPTVPATPAEPPPITEATTSSPPPEPATSNPPRRPGATSL